MARNVLVKLNLLDTPLFVPSGTTRAAINMPKNDQPQTIIVSMTVLPHWFYLCVWSIFFFKVMKANKLVTFLATGIGLSLILFSFLLVCSSFAGWNSTGWLETRAAGKAAVHCLFLQHPWPWKELPACLHRNYHSVFRRKTVREAHSQSCRWVVQRIHQIYHLPGELTCSNTREHKKECGTISCPQK